MLFIFLRAIKHDIFKFLWRRVYKALYNFDATTFLNREDLKYADESDFRESVHRYEKNH